MRHPETGSDPVTKNLIITGIGGQGVSFLSTLLRRAIGRKFRNFTGYDDRGGAQRFGHVASIIRFNPDRSSQRAMAIDFPDGGAHWVIGLEASEPLRFNAKISANTVVFLDSYIVPPTNVRREDKLYFSLEDLVGHYGRIGCTLIVRDFRALAKERSGTPLEANLLMLGEFLKNCSGLLAPTDFVNITGPRELAIIEDSYSRPTEC